VDPEEPRRLAQASKSMGLQHVVVTSVDRDDLPDGGASHFVKVIRALREISSKTTVEILTPDFQGSQGSLDLILADPPDIFNHNLETVPSLYRRTRPRSYYERSLKVLEYVKREGSTLLTKSGIMLGLGEKREEVYPVLQDLKTIGCDIVTLGQYLQPTRHQLPVQEFIPLTVYEEYKKYAVELGFRFVDAGPFVRSSYNAAAVLDAIKQGPYASISTN
jgi:lipoic acid synthetase